jgi:lipopolysaccharide export system protein LptA
MSKRYFRNSLLIAASFFQLAAMSDAAETESTAREPVVITSKRMQADKLGDKVTFTGKVTLKKEGMTLTSDTMIVFYDVASKDIREIEARGNVEVRKENRVAFSDHASYYSRDEKIVLTGDARIVENENELGGERITLFMRGDRSVVEGGKVLIYKDKQDKPLEGRGRP